MVKDAPTPSGECRLRGEVQRVYFRNQDTLYTVAGVETETGRETVTGFFSSLEPGRRYEFTGEWILHPRYGQQFRVIYCREELPATQEGIKAYLAGGFISGVGETLAGRIVERFGEETLEIIVREPERLQEVPGIGKKTAARIAAAVAENRELEQVMVFLQTHGISANLALKIYRHYGAQAQDLIRENPYRLAADVFGIGFVTADRIARHLGILLHDQLRLQAGLRHTLTEATYQQGHCYLPEEKLLQEGLKLLNVPDIEEPIAEDELLLALDNLVARGEMYREEEGIYLPYLYKAETGLAAKLKYQGALVNRMDEEQAHQAVAEAEKMMGITLAPQQRDVIFQSIKNSLLVVTGGPGTGKSTIVSGIIQALGVLNPEAVVLLAAPTGRAAKRLSKLTGLEAQTVHRLLGFRWEEGKGEFSLGEKKPLAGDLLVVDEFSMMDLPLAHQLLQAVPVGMRVVLVGDVDQLPSVGPGHVLRDIIASQAVPTIRLTHVYRQAETSQIVVNAHRINQGQMICTHGEQGDFIFIPREDPTTALEELKGIVGRAMQSLPLEEVQVITPMHNHILGVENLNRVLQEEINPPKPDKKEYQVGKTTFRVGDKVMVIKNNYDKGVFNGNLGRVVDIRSPRESEDFPGDTILVEIEGEVVPFDRSELDELTLAYAITVHKSQGSEFAFCIVLLSNQHWYMLQRNLFYTAVTRGKQMVVLLGSRRALARAIRNNAVRQRFTRLSSRLRSIPAPELPDS